MDKFHEMCQYFTIISPQLGYFLATLWFNKAGLKKVKWHFACCFYSYIYAGNKLNGPSWLWGQTCATVQPAPVTLCFNQ